MTLDSIIKYQETIEENNGFIKKLGSSLFEDFVYSLIFVGVPTSIFALSELGGKSNIFDLNQIGKACFLSAVSALANASKTRRKEWKNSDSFYYHKLKNVFGSEKGLNFKFPEFHKIYEEFIND